MPAQGTLIYVKKLTFHDKMEGRFLDKTTKDDIPLNNISHCKLETNYPQNKHA